MLQGLMRPGVELGRPGRGRGFDPEVAEKGQTVREEATADDEYTLVPERAQPLPIWKSCSGSRLGIETCSTGMSAAGYITVMGTYAPWSRPRSGSSATC